MSIAENIKNLREKHNLTQAQFGEIAGVSDKAVSTWEKGTAEPRMGAIQKIAQYFNISKGSIVDDEEATHRPLSLSDLSPSEVRILNKIRKLDSSDRLRIEERIDTFLESNKYDLKEEEQTG